MVKIRHSITFSGIVLIISLAGEAASAEPPSVAAIRSANERNAGLVTAAQFEENWEQEVKQSPETLEDHRRQMIEHLTKAKTDVLEKMEDASEAEKQRVLKQMDDHIGRVDASMAVARLNNRLKLKQVFSADYQQGRARTERTDLRDLKRLAEENHIGEMDQFSLDKGTVLILTGVNQTELMPKMMLATQNANRFSGDVEAYRLGLLPKSAFDPGLELSVRDGDGGRVVLEGRKDGRPVYEATLARELDFRLVELKQFDNQGRLLRETAVSDYKKIDGVPVPHRTHKKTNHLAQPGDYSIEERSVSRVTLNDPATVAEELFKIPPEYHVQVIGDVNPPSARITRAADYRSTVINAEGLSPGERFVQMQMDPWTVYVRELILRYKLDDEQSQKALAILDDCKGEAQRYVERVKARIDEALQSPTTAASTPPRLAIDRQAEPFKSLLKPLDEIFEKHLKPRLERLPTRAQRQAAEQTSSKPAR